MAVSIDKLREILLFRDLSHSELSDIGAIVEEFKLPADRLLFRQGDKPDAFYIVLLGELAVNKTFDGTEIHITNVSKGSIIGEMGFITDSPRSATIESVGDVDMLKISKKKFRKLLDEDNIAAYKMVHKLSYTISFRLARMSEKLAELAAAEEREKNQEEKKKGKAGYFDCIKKFFSL